jgi:hypothetical protein
MHEPWRAARRGDHGAGRLGWWRLRIPQPPRWSARHIDDRVQTNFLGAVKGGSVAARSTALHVGSTTIVVETEVRDEAGRLVAKVTQTQAVLWPRP